MGRLDHKSSFTDQDEPLIGHLYFNVSSFLGRYIKRKITKHVIEENKKTLPLGAQCGLGRQHHSYSTSLSKFLLASAIRQWE